MNIKPGYLVRNEIKIDKSSMKLHSLSDAILGEKIDSNISNLDKYVSLYQKNRKKLEDSFELSLTLTVEELRYLSNLYPKKLKKFKIWLYIQKPGEIGYEELKKFKNNFNMYAVVVNNLMTKHGKFKPHMINYNLYLEYSKKLWDIVSNIDYEECYNSNNPQINVFCKLLKEIVNNVQRGDADESYTEKLSKNLQKFERIPDEIIGLVSGECVCRGMSGIIRDACALIGIKTKVIKGERDIDGHAWNQVKLNGNWYNVDLTWDHANIKKNMTPYFILKSNKEFNRTRVMDESNNICCHGDYIYKRTIEHECNVSIPNEMVEYYLYNSKTKYVKNEGRIKKMLLHY